MRRNGMWWGVWRQRNNQTSISELLKSSSQSHAQWSELSCGSLCIWSRWWVSSGSRMWWSWMYASLSNVRLLNINRLILILWMREMSSDCRRLVRWVMCGLLMLITNSTNLSRSTKWSNRLFPLLSGEGVVSVHNTRVMASSTLKVAWTRLLRSWNGMSTKRLTNLSCRFWRTISIWSCSLGRSIIPATFALQRLTEEEIDSSGLCLVASNSSLDTSMSALKMNWVRNSWATSSQVQTLEGSKIVWEIQQCFNSTLVFKQRMRYWARDRCTM